jgi:hypothetical protein
MTPNLSFTTGGDALCIYLTDCAGPSWDQLESGPRGLPRNMVLGVALDLAGRLSTDGRSPNTLLVLDNSGRTVASALVPRLYLQLCAVSACRAVCCALISIPIGLFVSPYIKSSESSKSL